MIVNCVALPYSGSERRRSQKAVCGDGACRLRNKSDEKGVLYSAGLPMLEW